MSQRCMEYCCNTVRCRNFRNDSETALDISQGRDFLGFQLKKSFRWISYLETTALEKLYMDYVPVPWGHIVVVFLIRASYQLPSLSFHDNWASYSRDTIWPTKFKVKGQGQMCSSQHSVQLTHFLSVSHQDILSTPIPFVSWQSGLPFPRYNLTFKIKGQRPEWRVP